MDNSAFLRIKFTPLLKKISSENIDSKCCIEIVPELSDMQNLNQINWNVENDLVEYNIPVTYKIIIKKPDQTYELGNKVYHSCVDLLPAYLMENTDLASGDIKRIKSDNLLVLNSEEKCDVMPTKVLLANNESTNRYKDKSTTVQYPKKEDASMNHSSGVDKCFEANLDYDDNDTILLKTNLRVSRSEETLKAEVDKFDNATNTCDFINQSLTDLTKKNSTGSLCAYIESFNRKYGGRKLSLSPICSVNTWDKYSTTPIYVTNNTTGFAFCKGDTLDKANLCDIDDNLSFRKELNKENNKNMKNIPIKTESKQFFRIYETRTNVTIHMIDNTDSFQNSKDVKDDKIVPQIPIHRYVKDITTSVSRITMTSFEIDNNFNQKHSQISHNHIKIKNVDKSMDLSNKRKLTSNIKPVDVMFAKDTNNYLNYSNNNMTVCRIDPNQRRLARVSPALRVARFMKNFEEELIPLTQMLNEIKFKCVGLGLLDRLCGEFMPPAQKSIIFRPVSNVEYVVDESNSQQTNSVKSNRVVYTFLFNG